LSIDDNGQRRRRRCRGRIDRGPTPSTAPRSQWWWWCHKEQRSCVGGSIRTASRPTSNIGIALWKQQHCDRDHQEQKRQGYHGRHGASKVCRMRRQLSQFRVKFKFEYRYAGECEIRKDQIRAILESIYLVPLCGLEATTGTKLSFSVSSAKVRFRQPKCCWQFTPFREATTPIAAVAACRPCGSDLHTFIVLVWKCRLVAVDCKQVRSRTTGHYVIGVWTSRVVRVAFFRGEQYLYSHSLEHELFDSRRKLQRHSSFNRTPEQSATLVCLLP
jgi:hypothetical protein